MAKEKKKKEKNEAAKREEDVLEFWAKKDIFQKTLDKESPEGEFVFRFWYIYDPSVF